MRGNNRQRTHKQGSKGQARSNSLFPELLYMWDTFGRCCLLWISVFPFQRWGSFPLQEIPTQTSPVPCCFVDSRSNCVDDQDHQDSWQPFRSVKPLIHTRVPEIEAKLHPDYPQSDFCINCCLCDLQLVKYIHSLWFVSSS